MGIPVIYGLMSRKETTSRNMRTFRMHGDKRHGIAGFASGGCIEILKGSNQPEMLVVTQFCKG